RGDLPGAGNGAGHDAGARMTVQIGIDVGGTFTDLFALEPESGRAIVARVPRCTRDAETLAGAPLRQFLGPPTCSGPTQAAARGPGADRPGWTGGRAVGRGCR